MMRIFYGSSRLRSLFTGSLMLIVASIVLTSCSMGSMSSIGSGTNANLVSGNAGKDCTRVGILLPETSSVRWEANDHRLLGQAVTKAIPGAHIDYSNAQGDSIAQLNYAKQDLANGDCILIVAPHDSVVAANIVAVAKLQNVPVIAYDRLIQSKDLSYYVSFDNIQVGALQAQYIRDHAQSYAVNGQINIAMISGSQTDANALLFSIGAHNVLDPLFATHTEYHKIDNEKFTPNWSVSSALSEAVTMLSDSNNNVQVFYVANDDMAASVISVLKSDHITNNVLVTGQDATAAGVNAILTGNQAMTVYKPIAQEAASVGDLVKAIHDGTSTQPLTQGQVTATYDNGSIPSILDRPIPVDINNIKSTVIKDGFLTKADVCTGIAPGTAGVC